MADRDLHPTEGARYLLELAAETGAAASYRASIFTRDAVFDAKVTLAEDGSVTFDTTGASPELDDRLRSIAKLIARDAAKRRSDGLPAWPARVLRWRR